MKEVTNHLKDEDIAFVSICQDDTYERWIKMINDKNLTGVKLFAEIKDASFFKAYSVDGIPRFILIHREGIIISSNAKRSSNPELISELEGLLNEWH